MSSSDLHRIRLALPKGRMQEGVVRLLGDANIRVRSGAREYRPSISLEGYDVKLLKPQNIIEMLHHGSHHVGFAGSDWVAELNANVVELMDTELDPVRIVAAAPFALVEEKNGALAMKQPPGRPLVVTSEYERLTRGWIASAGITAEFVRSYGATEAFPPEDADCIVDNTATGQTLQANGLQIVAEVMKSSTRLYASVKAMAEPGRKKQIDDLVMLLQSVLEGRRRAMLEMNVSKANLEALVRELPCMREPTISPLHSGGGYAVKVAVLRTEISKLVPRVKELGGTDIVVTSPSQIVP